MLVCSSKLVQLHGCEGTTSTIHVLLSRSVLSTSVIACIKHAFILLPSGVAKVSIQVKDGMATENGKNKVKRDTKTTREVVSWSIPPPLFLILE